MKKKIILIVVLLLTTILFIGFRSYPLNSEEQWKVEILDEMEALYNAEEEEMEDWFYFDDFQEEVDSILNNSKITLP